MNEQSSFFGNKNLMVGGGVVVAVIAIAGYLLLKQSQNTSVTQTPVVTEVEKSQTATDSTAVKEIVVELTVTSEGLKFAPSELKVKEGDKVRLTYKNTKGSHNFVIDEFKVQTEVINAGQDISVEFVANKKGSFEFYCGVPGHKAAGMKGTLIVE